jgi:hypothetical protein
MRSNYARHLEGMELREKALKAREKAARARRLAARSPQVFHKHVQEFEQRALELESRQRRVEQELYLRSDPDLLGALDHGGAELSRVGAVKLASAGCGQWRS